MRKYLACNIKIHVKVFSALTPADYYLKINNGVLLKLRDLKVVIQRGGGLFSFLFLFPLFLSVGEMPACSDRRCFDTGSSFKAGQS